MSTDSTNIDFDRLLQLRLVVARYGEMDAARWWNTGDAARRTALLGRAGSLLMSRGFPRTHRFAQARLVFEVARARCAEVFDPPECVTLWKLPPDIEDEFDARWSHWLDNRDDWTAFFTSIESPPTDLLETLKTLELVNADDLQAAAVLRRSAESRAVQLPGFHTVNDALITQLAYAFSRGEAGNLAVPYARVDV